MADKTRRSPLVIDEQQRQLIQMIHQPRTAPLRAVLRTKVRLAYADHVPLATLATRIGTEPSHSMPMHRSDPVDRMGNGIQGS